MKTGRQGSWAHQKKRARPVRSSSNHQVGASHCGCPAGLDSHVRACATPDARDALTSANRWHSGTAPLGPVPPVPPLSIGDDERVDLALTVLPGRHSTVGDELVESGWEDVGQR